MSALVICLRDAVAVLQVVKILVREYPFSHLHDTMSLLSHDTYVKVVKDFHDLSLRDEGASAVAALIVLLHIQMITHTVCVALFS